LHIPNVYCQLQRRADDGLGNEGGSYEFFMKPFSDDVLLKAILDGIKHSQAALDHEAEIRARSGTSRVPLPPRTGGHGAGGLWPDE
jgi:hypothetical protein